uniref:Uncharacterized protein n=1 Tax=Knipowitschia caucasica TaxID=637954 RepID=A0AAV2MU68_KNICA
MPCASPSLPLVSARCGACSERPSPPRSPERTGLSRSSVMGCVSRLLKRSSRSLSLTFCAQREEVEASAWAELLPDATMTHGDCLYAWIILFLQPTELYTVE